MSLRAADISRSSASPVAVVVARDLMVKRVTHATDARDAPCSPLAMNNRFITLELPQKSRAAGFSSPSSANERAVNYAISEFFASAIHARDTCAIRPREQSTSILYSLSWTYLCRLKSRRGKSQTSFTL